MTDTALNVRNTAKRLLLTVEEMLAPASATPSPQRMKLDNVMHALEQAVMEYDRDKALTRMQQAGQEMEAQHGNRDDAK